ncbi:hypothetical protein NUW58_g1404 [Xylaria curta]|uniref:Uncharacterized protein n=1 Tax=Xylaria curta TaxID=42375 RepID=A0ACC1PN24_9PEZI|nr:hypothetical protein NUW58_g1404 [Xylaria curta]
MGFWINKADWPADGSQPFVWSYEDSKGYGTHGDYLFGWKGDALQRAMDSKALLSNGIATQSVDKANQCTIPNTVNEDIDSWLKVLPGQGGMPISKAARRENLFNLMHQLANLELDPLGLRPPYRISGLPGFQDFDTAATEDFYQSPNYSLDFKGLVCLCMAEDPDRRPPLRRVLRKCERNVGSIRNWRRLVDEISEIFDDADPKDDDPNDEDYVP